MGEVEAGLAAIVKEVDVPLDAVTAFDLFTRDIGAWWPVTTHSVTGSGDVRFESGVGGRIVETAVDGAEHVWGEVTVWDPPSRVRFTWHPGRGSDSAQSVDVRFTSVATGTRVRLKHRGWEMLGDRASAMRANYDTGWDVVLDCYVALGATSSR
jgi:uncharacterized protein YndB with AHSA1/START domain